MNAKIKRATTAIVLAASILFTHDASRLEAQVRVILPESCICAEASNEAGMITCANPVCFTASPLPELNQATSPALTAEADLEVQAPTPLTNCPPRNTNPSCSPTCEPGTTCITPAPIATPISWGGLKAKFGGHVQ